MNGVDDEMNEETKVLPVTSDEVVLILGSLTIEEIESSFDDTFSKEVRLNSEIEDETGRIELEATSVIC